MANDRAHNRWSNDRRSTPRPPRESAPPEAGHRPGEHPAVRRTSVVGPKVAIWIAAGLAIAALTYVAVVAGIIG